MTLALHLLPTITAMINESAFSLLKIRDRLASKGKWQG